MDIEKLFFELIRVAIGNADSLSHTPSNKEWKALYDMATKQSLVGVCFAALQQLGADADEGFARIGMSEMLYLTWMGMAAKIQQRNEQVNQQCADLQRRLSDDGFRSCVLKGQGVATLYGERLCGLRQSGDIDIWVDGDRDKALDWVRKQGAEVSCIDSVHSHAALFEDQLKFMVENDYAFTYHEYTEMSEKGRDLGVYVSGIKKVSEFQMYACCWPGCLSVMYDAEKIGLIQIKDVRKNNDTAMWLKVVQKAPCYLLKENLARYRRRAVSITPKPLYQRIWAHYPLFRIAEEMSPVRATFWVLMNVVGNAWKKMWYVKKY